MRALDRKLLRDLWRLRGQVLAVALVVASGVAVLVMSLASVAALQATTDAYYERYRFAHVFAGLKRAPERVAERIGQIDGVQAVETRIVEFALIDVADFPEPVVGQVVSVPEDHEPVLNRLAILEGRTVTSGRVDEVVVSEPFAEAHGLGVGDRLSAILGSKRRSLRIVGIALSPEFVYSIGPGQLMPDDRRFGVLWMGRGALAAAYDLEGAFNAVALSLLRGAEPDAVIERLDRILDRYGGTGAIAREDQISNWFLMNEIDQLRNVATILPTVFLAVAAFLANMVLARLVQTERTEIGLLKAFGYSNAEVGWHYVKLVTAMTGLGILLGYVLGYWLGRYNTAVYAEFYRFPLLLYRPGPEAFAIAAVVSVGAALVGCFGSVARATRLPPAAAMQPPPPPVYRRAHAGRGLAERLFDQPTRIVLRQIVRWPGRAFLTAFGVGLGIAVLVTALQWRDAIDHLLDTYYFGMQHQDVTIGLAEARDPRVVRELGNLPGVLAVEPARVVPAMLEHGPNSRRESVQGVTPDARLVPVKDAVAGTVVPVSRDALVVSAKLAEVLDVGIGDTVTIEVLEGARPTLRLPVVGIVDTYIGTPAYTHIETLGRAMKQASAVNQVHMTVDGARQAELLAKLKEMPGIASVMLRRVAVETFRSTMAATVNTFISFFVFFACTLAFGVVYNSARIALSERGRELATLRVLGFSRREITYILLGEIGLLVYVALPLGCLTGFGLAWFINNQFDTELYRVPLVFESDTFGYAILIGVLAASVSAALVGRRLRRLDLIAVLKTRE